MAYANVLETVDLIKSWPTKIRTDKNLAMSLAQVQEVRGYNQPFDKIPLNDRLNVDVCHEWGPLVVSARSHPNK